MLTSKFQGVICWLLLLELPESSPPEHEITSEIVNANTKNK